MHKYNTKEMHAECYHCPKYVALIGCSQNKTPKTCRGKTYNTKEKK